MPNTYAAKKAYHKWLEDQYYHTVMYFTSGHGPVFRPFNTHNRCTNTQGVEMMLAALNEYMSSSDPIFYIFYMENDRLKIAALANRVNMDGGGTIPMGMFGSRICYPINGDWSAFQTFIVVDLSAPVEVGFNNLNLPNNRATIFKWDDEEQHNTDTLGFTTTLQDDENDANNPSFLQKLLESEDIIPLGYVPTYWSYATQTTGRRILVKLSVNGNTYMLGLPLVGVGGQRAPYRFASPDFTLSEMKEIMEQCPKKARLETTTIVYNARTTATPESTYNQIIMTKCQSNFVDWPNRVLIDQAGIIDEGSRCSLLIKGHKWDDVTTPVDEETINNLRSFAVAHDKKGRNGYILFTRHEDGDPRILSAAIRGTSYVLNQPLSEHFKLLDKVPQIHDNLGMIQMRRTPLGDHFLQRRGGVMFNSGKGTIVAHVSPSVDVERGTVNFKFTPDHKFLASVGADSSLYRDLSKIVNERGKKLKRELNYDRIVKNAYVRLQRKGSKISNEALVTIKKDLEVPDDLDIRSVYDNLTSGRGFAGPEFLVDLMKELGPIGWGATIVDGSMVWFKDTLRYETRGSRSEWESYANMDRPFMRFEIPFHAAIILSRSKNGYRIDTNLWEAANHPNINGVNGSLCHGGVGESVLVKSRGGENIVVAINKKNGRLKFREALKAIRQTAELIESSTVIGDTDTGFFRQSKNFKSASLGFVPLFKYNVFSGDVPEEQMREIEDLYDHDGDPLVLLLPPYVMRRVTEGMKDLFR